MAALNFRASMRFPHFVETIKPIDTVGIIRHSVFHRSDEVVVQSEHRTRGLLVGLFSVALIMMSHVGHADDEGWRIGASLTYQSGDYGTGSRTTLWSAPLTVRRFFSDGDLTVTIPYLHLHSAGSVTVVNGIPIQISNTKTTRQRQQLPPTITTADGLGDITVQGRFYLVDEHAGIPTISLTAKLKTPTANPDLGLGTGEFDENVGIEVMKKLGEDFIAFFDGSYTFIGKQPGLNLLNQWFYDVGLGYRVSQKLMISAYYQEFYKLVATQVNPRELLFSASYKATPALRLNASTTAGLSNGAPQYGITGGISVQF